MNIIKACILVVGVLVMAPAGLMSCLHGGTLSSITVTPADATVARGTITPFIATARFSDGTTLIWTTAVTWTSSNTDVALISNGTGSQGFATSVGVGTTTITATDMSNHFSGSTTLTVTNALSMIVTPPSPVISLTTTTQQQFTATETFANGTALDMTTLVFWESSDPAIAQISNATGSQGLATAVGVPGTTIITATDLITNVTGTAILTVNP
jgi:hypothetical protein